MAGFVPSTPAQRHEMLEAVGYADEKALFAAMVQRPCPPTPSWRSPRARANWTCGVQCRRWPIKTACSPRFFGAGVRTGTIFQPLSAQ
jgi:hypothetical protein